MTSGGVTFTKYTCSRHMMNDFASKRDKNENDQKTILFIIIFVEIFVYQANIVLYFYVQ